MMEEEFELVPLSPLRRLEKRLKELEMTSGSQVMKDLIEVVKTNQKIVDDLVRINTTTLRELSEVNVNLKLLVERIDNFLDRVEVATTEPSAEIMSKLEELMEQNKRMNEAYQSLQEKLEKMERRVNAILLTRMAKRRV